MENLIGRRNIGYVVVEQGDKAVIARDEEGNYVAWSYKTDEKGDTDFFWGRYTGDNYFEARKRFEMKEQGIYSGN